MAKKNYLGSLKVKLVDLPIREHRMREGEIQLENLILGSLLKQNDVKAKEHVSFSEFMKRKHHASR